MKLTISISKRWGRGAGALALAMFVVAVTLGCDAGPPVMTGAVTLDGAPLATGRITLVPSGRGRTAGGAIEEGRYTIGGEQAPQPGKYLVRISSMQPTGRQIDSRESATGKVEEVHEAVPSRYNTLTELSVEVTAQGPNICDFSLVSEQN